jgi:glycosyltransferase involved in cell wall biosynthesis
MDKKRNTLVILSPGFAESEADSSCLPAQQDFITALNNRFPKLNIVILSFIYPFTKEQYAWQNNRVIPFNGGRLRKFLRSILWFRIWRTLQKIKKEENITGIISLWLGECAFIGKRFAKKNGLMHYCWMLGQDARSNNRYVKRIKPKAEELIAISDALKIECFRNYSILPKHLIPIGIDPCKFSANTERDIDILAAGSLIPLKQYELFVDIIASLKKKFRKLNVLLCGKGPDEINIIRKIVEHDLQGTIILKGEIPHHEVLALMQRSKIFLHTSSYEGLSGVCIEALYAGAHVISFCKAMNDEIEHWHIANTKEEMIKKANELLENNCLTHKRVAPFLMNDSAAMMMELFNYRETAT